MSKLIDVLESGFRALFGYESNYRTIEEVIDEEIKEKTGRKIFSCSKAGRVHGTVRLIELAKKSLIISISHRDYHELKVVNDSYIYSALYDAAERGVNIDLVLTPEAQQKISQDILNITEMFIEHTDEFRSCIMVDGKLGKSVYSKDGKTYFWFC